jgi:hypothetical protein
MLFKTHVTGQFGESWQSRGSKANQQPAKPAGQPRRNSKFPTSSFLHTFFLPHPPLPSFSRPSLLRQQQTPPSLFSFLFISYQGHMADFIKQNAGRFFANNKKGQFPSLLSAFSHEKHYLQPALTV